MLNCHCHLLIHILPVLSELVRSLRFPDCMALNARAGGRGPATVIRATVCQSRQSILFSAVRRSERTARRCTRNVDAHPLRIQSPINSDNCVMITSSLIIDVSSASAAFHLSRLWYLWKPFVPCLFAMRRGSEAQQQNNGKGRPPSTARTNVDRHGGLWPAPPTALPISSCPHITSRFD